MMPVATSTFGQTKHVGLEVSYSNFGEMVLAVARVAFRVILIVRLLAFAVPTGGVGQSKVLVALVSLLATIALSIWAARRAKRRAFDQAGHVLSALADVMLCFVSLLSTAIWPEAEYPGLLHKPDVAFLSVIVFASALRLQPVAIAASAAASMAALLVLAHVDATLNHRSVAWRGHDVEMSAILIGVAAVAAYFACLVARRLLRDLARETSLVSRGQQHLREVLREHHDVRTLVSAARLHLDLLMYDIPMGPLRDRAATAAQAVGAIADAIAEIRNRTLGESTFAGELARVELADVVADVVATLRARFSSVEVRGVSQLARLKVLLFGGERALVHVLLNLLVNACEGDGRRGASFIELRAELDAVRPGFARLEVLDDGPGFKPEILHAGPKQGLTTKSCGGGLGLGLVTDLVRASSGDILVENRPDGGARVTLWLRADASPSRRSGARRRSL
jgi:signal transduction histidine kinase